MSALHVGSYAISTAKLFTGQAEVKHIYDNGLVLLRQGDQRIIARREYLQAVIPPQNVLLLPAPCAELLRLVERQERRGIVRDLYGDGLGSRFSSYGTIYLPAALTEAWS